MEGLSIENVFPYPELCELHGQSAHSATPAVGTAHSSSHRHSSSSGSKCACSCHLPKGFPKPHRLALNTTCVPPLHCIHSFEIVIETLPRPPIVRAQEYITRQQAQHSSGPGSAKYRDARTKSCVVFRMHSDAIPFFPTRSCACYRSKSAGQTAFIDTVSVRSAASTAASTTAVMHGRGSGAGVRCSLLLKTSFRHPLMCTTPTPPTGVAMGASKSKTGTEFAETWTFVLEGSVYGYVCDQNVCSLCCTSLFLEQTRMLMGDCICFDIHLSFLEPDHLQFVDC